MKKKYKQPFMKKKVFFKDDVIMASGEGNDVEIDLTGTGWGEHDNGGIR